MTSVAMPTKKNSMKDYSKQTRVFDPDGFRRRADCICFRDASKTEVLMVSSRNYSGEWTLPGGGLEPGETARQTAIREALEEAGVTGEIDRCIGTYEKLERKTRTEVYTLIVREEVESWQDCQEFSRERRWFTADKATSRLKNRKPLQYMSLQAACNGKLLDLTSDGTIHQESIGSDGKSREILVTTSSC